MFKAFFSKIGANKAKHEDTSSEFSKFFRTASSATKKKVFLDVARKASEEQREVMKSVGLAR
jgi:hypothetical protein